MKNDVLQKFELEKFYDELDSIISGFGTEGRIFSNEEQFQFELALEIERQYQKDEKGYPKVRLEVLSYGEIKELAKMDVDERKKMYTDIIIDINDLESIAIELKYKTKGETSDKYYLYKTENRTSFVFEQGASNNGCYFFLKDVERLEHLVNGEKFDCDSNRKVIKGYAVIISNDDSYWTPHKSLMDEFAIYPTSDENEKGIRVIGNGTLSQHLKISSDGEILDGRAKQYQDIIIANSEWLKDYEEKISKEGRKKSKKEEKILSPITLKGEYPCKWNVYYDEGCIFRKKRNESRKRLLGFKYMIFKVEPTK